MYVDKIYNRLFSQNDVEGIERLFKEVRAFAANELNTKLQQLINTINVKKSRGEDFTKELQEYRNIQSQLQSGSQGSGMDPTQLINKFNNGLNQVTTTVRNVNMLGDLVKNLGGALFHPRK